VRAPILVAAVLLAACGSAVPPSVAGAPAPVANARPAAAPAIAARDVELTFDIVELLCHTCAGQIAAGAQRIPGVTRVSADMLDHRLIVRFDPAVTTERQVVAAIDKVVDSIAQ
jgi:copper chaperone CopZ